MTGDKTEEQEFAEVARMLKMDKQHVREMVNISRDMISLDAQVASSDNDRTSVSDFIEDDRYDNPDEEAISNAMKRDIGDVLNTLKPNEAKVLSLRYGLNGTRPMSLKEVGDTCNLTKERIRQIEKHAIVRMRHPRRMQRLEAYIA